MFESIGVVSFTHPFNTQCKIKCYTKIKVKEFRYDNSDTEYYKIEYEHKFVDENKQITENPPFIYPHPFADENKSLKDFSEGNIIIKNPLTQVMVKFLVMPDNELQKYISILCPKQYRTTIIHDIANKWY